MSAARTMTASRPWSRFFCACWSLILSTSTVLSSSQPREPRSHSGRWTRGLAGARARGLAGVAAYWKFDGDGVDTTNRFPEAGLVGNPAPGVVTGRFGDEDAVAFVNGVLDRAAAAEEESP